MSNICYWEKLTLSKFVWKINFSERKFGEMHWLWRAKRYKVYSRKRLFWHYCLQLSFVYKVMSQNTREIKGSYQSFLGNEVDFRDIKNIYPNILARNYTFRKLGHGFVEERALIMTLISSCHSKTLVTVDCERKDPKTHF